MKKIYFLISIAVCFAGTGCTVGKGCPTNGKNIGAERILSGDPKALKAVKRAGKVQALNATTFNSISSILISMSYQLISAAGNVEAVIDDNCGMTKFLSIANTLTKDCKVRFTAKEDNSDTVDWFFTYKGHRLKLHYNIYNGVSIANSSSKNNDTVAQLASMLEKKFF